MGFDLYAKNNAKEGAEYFRNNVWWWPGLWSFVCAICDDVLTKEEAISGYYNNGCEISRLKSKLIASRIKEALKDGRAKKHIEEWKKNNKKEYPATLANIKDFMRFARDSGGFTIN